MEWTVERVDELTRMWAEGYSARQIAEMLGGVTRNAVIGKAHRLNLQRGVIVAPPVPVRPPPEPRVAPRPVRTAEFKSWMCSWPTEDAGRYGLHICGKTTQPGRPHCAEHITAAYLRKKRTAA